MDKHEILIVGAGPVGLAAGVELQRRGFACSIIDDDDGPTPQSRALAINPRTLEILEPAGISERLIAAGNRVNAAVIQSDGRDRMRLDLSRIPHRFNFVVTLPQSETEQLMIEWLREQGLELQWNTRLDQFQVERDRYVCKLDVAGGDQKIVSAQRLIGADGSHSVVRKTLGIEFPGTTMHQDIGLADVQMGGWPHPFDRIVINRLKHYTLGFFPIRAGFGRFVSTRSDVLNCIPAQYDVQEVRWESSFRISYRQVPTYQLGNAFLAGDAAHIHSPVGGRGMNMGIEDAATLAWLIEQGRAADYTRLRHPVGARVLKFTRQQTDLMLFPSPMRQFVIRHLAPWAMKLPPVQRFFLKRIAGQESPTPTWLANSE